MPISKKKFILISGLIIFCVLGFVATFLFESKPEQHEAQKEAPEFLKPELIDLEAVLQPQKELVENVNEKELQKYEELHTQHLKEKKKWAEEIGVLKKANTSYRDLIHMMTKEKKANEVSLQAFEEEIIAFTTKELKSTEKSKKETEYVKRQLEAVKKELERVKKVQTDVKLVNREKTAEDFQYKIKEFGSSEAGEIPKNISDEIENLRTALETEQVKNKELTEAILRWQQKAGTYDFKILKKEKEYEARLKEQIEITARKIEDKNEYNVEKIEEIKARLAMKLERQQREQVRVQKESIQQLKNQLTGLEAERRLQFDLQSKRMKDQVRYAERNLDATAAKLESSREKLISVEDEKRHLLREVKRIAGLEKEVKARKQQLEENSKELAATEAQLQALRQEKGSFEARYEKLSTQFTQLETLHQKDRATFFYNMGLSYSYVGLYRDAVLMYEKVLEITPKDPATHYNLGILYDEHLDKIELGLEHYKQYMLYEKDPDKRNKVKIWVDMANRRFGSDRRTHKESARKAFEALFLT